MAAKLGEITAKKKAKLLCFRRKE